MTLQTNVAHIIDDAVKRGAVAGALFGAVDRTGRVLVAESAGVRALGVDEKAGLDTIFPIFSLTKLITAIAAMQLVEQGKLTLDAPLETVLPELSQVQILNDDGTLRPATQKITLRMLLSHTAGFSYSFNPIMAAYLGAAPGELVEASGKRKDVLGAPLLFEPGTGWEYGVGIDWAGEAVSRVSGISLGEYFEANIFGPLGITDMSLHLTPEQRANLAGLHVRRPDGSLAALDWSHMPFVRAAEYESGGAGAFGTLASYLKILAAVANGGVGPNGARILEEATVRSMFQDQADVVPAWTDAIRAGTDINQLVTGEAGSGRGWGLSFQINLRPLATGRGAGSATWQGAANLYYAIDPVKGVACALFSQSVPVFDPPVCKLFAECETALYAGL